MNHKTGNIYTPKETVVAEKAMAWALKIAMGSKLPVDNYDIILAVDLWPARRGLGDWDNYAKLCSDASNHVVVGDDRQITMAQVRLHYDTGEDPRTEVRFATVGHPYPPKRSSRK
jgi:Holliday junction resolvase RusA-like endonuclease